MNKWIKRGLIGIAAIGITAAAALALGVYMGERKAQRRIDIKVAAVPIPSDAASLERGNYLFRSRGCTDCHGAQGEGKVFIDGDGMYVRAPNISPGADSATAKYQPVDWVRSIRHGVKPDGRPAFIMPSEDYNRFTDADLGALVAYIKQLPAATGKPFELRLSPMLKTLYAVGAIRDAAERIDHTLPPAQPVAEDGSAQHGAYVVNMCLGCHGEKLSGGKIPGTPPDWPPAANLTPGEGTSMARYADAAQFTAMLRTGKRPDGSAVSPVMPFGSLREMSDIDAKGLYAYLKTVPPVAMGNR